MIVFDDMIPDMEADKKSRKYLTRKNFDKLLQHLFDIEFKKVLKIITDYTKEPYSFLVKDPNLPSDNSLTFKRNL